MRWCEAQQNVEYVLAYANERRRGFTWDWNNELKAAYEQQRQQIASTLEPLAAQSELWLNWMPSFLLRSGTSRSTIAPSLPGVVPAAWCANQPTMPPGHGVIVTSFSTQQMSAGSTHADYYCPRGEMETASKNINSICERDRTSTHEFESNSTQVVFSLCLCPMQEKSGSTVTAQTELATCAAAAPSASNSSRWQPKSALVFDGDCYQFLLDWTISVCSRLSTIAAGTSFGIICHFCDNTYFEIDAWGEPTLALSCLKLLFWLSTPCST